MKITIKGKSKSEKAAAVGMIINLITWILFCIYGAVYQYFDTVVCLTIGVGAVCAFGYIFIDHRATEMLNLAATAFLAYGMGLFALNSFPVWADRLNNITMYGSRGTLVPVIIIIILCLITAVCYIISCFQRKESDR